MTQIDPVEVTKHTTKDSCWLVLYDKVYDVTEFLNEHPGGAKLLLKSSGKDATSAFEAVHNADVIEEMLPAASYLGEINVGAIPTQIPAETVTAPSLPSHKIVPEYPPLDAILNTDDFRTIAQEYLTPEAWAYYSSAADDETCPEDNARLFRMLKLRPRVMRNVDPVSTSSSILGFPTSLPMYICPTGLAKYAHPDAERNIARAAGAEGIAQVIPTSPSLSLEDIAAARVKDSQPQFFQLYLNRDHEKARAMINRADKLGMKALFITVDSPVMGKRERDDRLKGVGAAAGIAQTAGSKLCNPTLVWEDLAWVRSITNMKIVLKGVQSVEDAVLAYESETVDGIVLSNHGGRSQDTSQAPILTLLEIRQYAPHLIKDQRFEIYVDGSIRRGTDVVKCLALGATAVGVGRPILYSMCGGYGENGVRKLFQILRGELEMNMALVGASSIADLSPQMVNSRRAEMEVMGGIKL